MDSLWGYTAAGYALTGATLAAYVWWLFARARRARERAAAVSGKGPRSPR